MEGFLTLKDHVYNYISEQIKKGNLIPGEKVNENSISDKMNISRTPVREALIQLSSEGLLENVPRKGFIIKHLNMEEAIETYSIIGVLDGFAIALACPLIDEKHLKEMEYYIATMDIAIEAENYSRYYRLQEEFHEIYLNLCPNKSLAQILLQLKKKFLKKEYELNEKDDIKEFFIETNLEHKHMIELIKKSDAKELERYVKEVHWNAAKAYMETL